MLSIVEMKNCSEIVLRKLQAAFSGRQLAHSVRLGKHDGNLA